MSKNKNILNLLIICFITFVLYVLYQNTNKFETLLESYTKTNTNDSFVNIAKLESQTGNIETSDGTCNKPNDPKYVAENYLVCCPENNPSNTCMCFTDKMVECRKGFDKCFADTVNKYKDIRKQKEQNIIDMEKQISILEEKIKQRKVPYFQIKVLEKQINQRKSIVQTLKTSLEEEPKVPAGIKKQCQQHFKKCVKPLKLKSETNNYLLPRMKKRDQSSAKICEVPELSDNNIDKCKQYCNNMSNCKAGIYNKMSRSCELYDKNLIDKEPGAESGDIGYIPFVKESFVSNSKSNLNINSNNNKKNTSRNKTKQLLNELDTKYKSSSTCKDTVNNDLEQLKETYIFQDIDKSLKVNTDLKTQLCRMDNVSLSKCKTQCLQNDMCQYIYYGNGNDSLSNNNNKPNNKQKELKNSKYFRPNNTCKLYSGYPLFEGDKVKLSKNKDANGTYYLKITRESIEQNNT